MDLNHKELRLILAEIYKNACLDEDCDMRELAIVLEYLAQVFGKYPTLQAWRKVKIDLERFEKKAYYKRILEFRSSVNKGLLEKAIGSIERQAAEDRDLAYTQFFIFYAEAMVNWEGEIFGGLCEYMNDLLPKDTTEKYNQLNQLVWDLKWPEVYPFFMEFAENEELPANIRSYFYLYCAQIVLYYFGYPNLIESLIQKSEEAYPENDLINRVKGEYLIIKNDLEKARAIFLNALNMDPNQIENYSNLGDSYLKEQKFEAAEQWYNDAVQINFLETLPYSKLILLLGEPALFESRSGEIERLLGKAAGFLENNKFGNNLYILHMDVANAFKKAKEYDKSIEYFLKAIDLKPGFSAAKIELAYVYVDKSEFDEAENWLRAAIYSDKESMNFSAYWALGWLYEAKQLNNISKSIEYYEKCLGLRSIGDDRVYNILGILYYSLGENERSVEYYEKAINEYPHEIVYHNNLKSALEKIGENNALIRFYDQLLACFPKRGESFNEAGVFHFNLGNYQRALELYDSAVSMDPDNRVFWENRGLVKEKLGNYDLAIADYLKSIEIQEDDFIFNAIGRLKYWQGKIDEAILYYSKAIELDANHPVFLENRALAFEKKGLYQEALADYSKVIELKEDPITYNSIGKLSYWTNNFSEAIEAYSKAIILDSSNAIFYENRGLAYISLQKFSLAEQDFLKSLSIVNSKSVWNQLGIMKMEQNQYEKAIEFFSKALSIAPNEAILWENRALAKETLGWDKEASLDYQKALNIIQSPISLNGLGKISYRKSDFEKACVFFENAVKLDPDNEDYRNNLQLAREKKGFNSPGQ